MSSDYSSMPMILLISNRYELVISALSFYAQIPLAEYNGNPKN
jgi:hypothetical protein